jgi:hypothetical protein
MPKCKSLFEPNVFFFYWSIVKSRESEPRLAWLKQQGYGLRPPSPGPEVEVAQSGSKWHGLTQHIRRKIEKSKVFYINLQIYIYICLCVCVILYILSLYSNQSISVLYWISTGQSPARLLHLRHLILRPNLPVLAALALARQNRII